MSHFYAAVVFRADKKQARGVFQTLNSSRYLDLFRQENRVWSIAVDHFDPDLEQASQLREMQSLARQVSKRLGAALVEVYHSFNGLRQQLHVRDEIVFDNLEAASGTDGLDAVNLEGQRFRQTDDVSEIRQFYPNELVEKRLA